MKEISKNIFRAYDIRGVVNEDFDAEWVLLLGKALGTYFLSKKQYSCVVGFDCRHSSVEYHEALTEGILSTGVSVISIGMVPTPVLYFGIKFLNRTAGVMITASHNPPEFNGFKIWSGEGTIHTTEIEAVYTLMKEGTFAVGKGFGSIVDIIPAYVESIIQRITLKKPVKVIVDGGNGAGGEICVEVLSKIGVTCIDINCTPNGAFPAHHPDPVVEANMLEVRQAIEDYTADFGIGLDGDADRLGVMDETGRLFFGDELLAIYARDFLSRNKNAIVIGDVKCSALLFKDIEKHGGKPLMWRTGHSMIKEAMKSQKAKLAGEMSGHMFFAEDWYGFDDAIYAAAKLAEIFSKQHEPFSSILGWEPMHNTPEIHIVCDDAIKFAVVETLQQLFTADFFSTSSSICGIDGVRVTFDDGWALVRASNTQPVLVLRFEAKTEERLDAIRSIIETSVMKVVIEHMQEDKKI